MTTPFGHALPPNTTAPPKFDIEVFNQDATQSRPLGPYMSAQFEWTWGVRPGMGQIKVMRDHPLAGRLMQCGQDVVPIRTFKDGIPWDGRVLSCVTEGQPGREVVTANLIDNKRWLMSLLGWPNPIFPVEIQFPKHDIMFGPKDFVLKWFVARNAIRMDKPLHVKLPINTYMPTLPKVGDVDSLDDLLSLIAGTDLIALYSRMTPLDQLVQSTIEDAELDVPIHLWTPSDGDPGGVFNVDGLGILANIFDYIFTDNIFNFDNPNNILDLVNPANWGQMIQPGYIVDTRGKRQRQHMRWRTDAGNIVSYRREVTHPTAHQVIVGGKSPDWINRSVEWAANMAIQAILNAIAPGLGTFVVGDFFDDVLFAYNKFENHTVEGMLGRHAYGEAFADSTSAWTLDALATGLSALKKHAGSDSLRINTRTGTPDGRGYVFGNTAPERMFDIGDVMLFWDQGAIVEDYVSSVVVSDNRQGWLEESITIGDDKPQRDGLTRMLDKMHQFSGVFNAFANTTG